MFRIYLKEMDKMKQLESALQQMQEENKKLKGDMCRLWKEN